MSSGLEVIIELGEGVKAQLENRELTVTGPKGEIKRKIIEPAINFNITSEHIKISTKKDSKSQKKALNTLTAHLNNLVKGVKEEYVYKLKICSGHFPMNVSVKGDVFEIKNFIGEKVPRTLKIMSGAQVNIQGEIIEVKSINKEVAGQVAASIEKLTRRPNFDKRIFQDGIYIIEKDGRVL